jgi:hypothetical protein
MLKNDTDEILVEGKGEFIEEVKKEIQNLHSKGLSVNAKYLEEQAENIRYLQSQREENDQLFVAQQQEIEELERY